MRNILPYRFLVLFFLTSISFGCGLKTFVPVTMPAQAGDVLEFRKVAVSEFSTDRGNGNKGGGAYTSAFESEIAGVTFNNNKLFTVLDRQNMDKILKEQKFQMTIADEDSVVEMGKLLGVSGIWTGEASEHYSTNTWYENELYCAAYDNGTCILYNTTYYQCLAQDIILNVTPKLTNIATGTIVYSTTFKGTSGYSSCKYNLGGISRGELWNRAMKEVLNKFRKEIAPYIQLTKVDLMTSAKNIENESSKTLFKEGIQLVKNGKTAEACAKWQKALEDAPMSLSLNYNNAICDEIAEKYDKAMDKLIKSQKIAENKNELVVKAIERNELNIKYQKMVREQLAK